MRDLAKAGAAPESSMEASSLKDRQSLDNRGRGHRSHEHAESHVCVAQLGTMSRNDLQKKKDSQERMKNREKSGKHCGVP